MSQLKIIREKAAGLNKKVILPEAETDIRVIQAGVRLHTEKLAVPVFLGSESAIHNLAEESNTRIPGEISILPVMDDLTESEKISYFREKLHHKNPTDIQILAMCASPLFTAGWLLHKGEADAVVAGSVASTPDVIRAALRTVGVADGSSIVSSSFLMEMADGNVFTFADCAVVPYPDSEQLASIGLDAGYTHQKLTGNDPVIAFLSFSTKGSASHKSVELVRNAFSIASGKNTGWLMDGELQFDTAFIPDIARRKAPESPAGGKTNVFVFPNLDAGNIAYKITERLAGATATGPILQGLGKPYMDLSRGCSVHDIVNTACVGILLS
jgi:phosphate acetyltransferase